MTKIERSAERTAANAFKKLEKDAFAAEVANATERFNRAPKAPLRRARADVELYVTRFTRETAQIAARQAHMSSAQVARGRYPHAGIRSGVG